MFVTLIGVGLGGVAWLLVPGRRLLGWALLPAYGGASAAIVWVALTWARFKWDQPLIWLITLVAAAGVAYVAGLLQSRGRRRVDERRFAEVRSA